MTTTIRTDEGDLELTRHENGTWYNRANDVYFERTGSGEKTIWRAFLGGKQCVAIKRFTLEEAVWLYLRGFTTTN